MDNSNKQGLREAYQRAGSNFLAYRLEKLFLQIKTPEDIALHNDILKEVLTMVEGKETFFFHHLSSTILAKDTTKTNFLKRIADWVFMAAQKGNK